MHSRGNHSPVTLKNPKPPAPLSFEVWRRSLSSSGVRPVVVVAGSRGKSTVVRLLDSVFKHAGLKTATWTDFGVEIEGMRQRGELVPWSRIMDRLDEGTLDVAVREIEWLTVPTAGLDAGTVPLLAITNVCANREACLVQDEAKMAAQFLPSLIRSATADGTVVLNGEDFAVVGEETVFERPQLRVALSRETPLLSDHLEIGGYGAWIEDGSLTIGSELEKQHIAKTEELGFALHGSAGFEIHNALMASAIANCAGIENSTIADALTSFRPSPRSMPGSFNVFEVNGVTVIVDRPSPSWFLRPILRATRDRAAGRLLTITGLLGSVPDFDLAEVGRLLGRASNALILNDSKDRAERVSTFRQ
jgi:cyanophycin synthetase